jgi:hypothetical protein
MTGAGEPSRIVEPRSRLNREALGLTGKASYAPQRRAWSVEGFDAIGAELANLESALAGVTSYQEAEALSRAAGALRGKLPAKIHEGHPARPLDDRLAALLHAVGERRNALVREHNEREAAQREATAKAHAALQRSSAEAKARVVEKRAERVAAVEKHPAVVAHEALRAWALDRLRTESADQVRARFERDPAHEALRPALRSTLDEVFMQCDRRTVQSEYERLLRAMAKSHAKGWGPGAKFWKVRDAQGGVELRGENGARARLTVDVSSVRGSPCEFTIEVRGSVAREDSVALRDADSGAFETIYSGPRSLDTWPALVRADTGGGLIADFLRRHRGVWLPTDESGAAIAPPPVSLATTPETVHVPNVGAVPAIRPADLLPGDVLGYGVRTAEVVSAEPKHDGSKWWYVVTRTKDGKEHKQKASGNVLMPVYKLAGERQIATRAERLGAEAERVEGRAERYSARSTAHAEKSAGARSRAMKHGERFYMGQPILVGHHSEKSARAAKKRMDAADTKAYEHHKASERLAWGAASREGAAERLRAAAALDIDALRAQVKETIELAKKLGAKGRLGFKSTSDTRAESQFWLDAPRMDLFIQATPEGIVVRYGGVMRTGAAPTTRYASPEEAAEAIAAFARANRA